MRVSKTDHPLDDVIMTLALAERTPAPRDMAADHAGLSDLAHEAATGCLWLAAAPRRSRHRAVRRRKRRVSLLEPGVRGQGVFRWVALSGACRGIRRRNDPGRLSPCGVC